MDVSAIIFCNDEEENLPELFDTLTDIDEKIVINHLSTDKTEQVAKDLGATVITQGNDIDEATQDDVDTFRERFGFLPVFTAGNKIPNWPPELNRVAKLAKHDWILWIDADERLSWNREKMEKILEKCDVVACQMYTNGHDPYTVVKLAKRSKTWWECRIHSGIVGIDTTIASTDAMHIIHHQRPRDYRAGYLPTLEYAYLKDQDSRSNFYLAREYFSYKQYDKAIKFFLIYLKTAYDKTEITKTYFMLCRMYWSQGQEEEAYACIFHALQTDPTAKDCLMLLSEMVRPKDGLVWKKFITTLE